MCSCRTATSPEAFRLERSSHRSRHQAPMSGQPDLPAAVNNGASATYTRPSLVKALYTNQRTRLSAAKTKTNKKFTGNSLCWVAGPTRCKGVYGTATLPTRNVQEATPRRYTRGILGSAPPSATNLAGNAICPKTRKLRLSI